jgi:hypothetical protein
MPELTRPTARQLQAGSVWQRFIAAIEPWYNWGEIYVERMEGMHAGSDGFPRSIGEGPVQYFEIQWLGVHLAVQFGRTPSATASDDVVGRDASLIKPTTNTGVRHATL